MKMKWFHVQTNEYDHLVPVTCLLHVMPFVVNSQFDSLIGKLYVFTYLDNDWNYPFQKRVSPGNW